MSKLIHSDMDAAFGDLECEWCVNEWRESGESEDYLNAHVAYNELRILEDRLVRLSMPRYGPVDGPVPFPVEVVKFTLGILGGQAKASVAETGDYELICWCGHSLHFPECDDRGTCHLAGSTHHGQCHDRYVAIGE